MLKSAVILKRVLILAMLSACLAWVSFDSAKSVYAATTYVCCKDCNGMTEICGESCNDNQECIDACLAEEQHCFEICTRSILLCP
jgi:hypothetical protein